jgi:hypothetical protein
MYNIYNQAVSREKDDNALVIFRNPTEEEMEGLIDDKRTRDEGHTVYKEMLFCEIRWPADRQRIGVFPAHSPKVTVNGQDITYAMYYKPEYEAWLQKRTPTITGTPLESLPFLTQSKRYELKAMNVLSVEVLASLDGPALSNLGMGGRQLQQEAKAWLENAKGSADVVKMAAEIADLRRMLEEERGTKTNYAMAPNDNKFLSMPDEEIKAFIKETTGQAPRGQPSRDTLIRMAQEVAEHAQENAA